MSLEIFKSNDSSVIHYGLFDADNHIMWLQVGNNMYQYFGVTHKVWNELINSTSKGTYFNKHIKERYAFALITSLT